MAEFDAQQVTLQRLRITSVGNKGESLKAIGEELELYARSLNLNFDMSVVEISNLENMKPEDFNLHDGYVGKNIYPYYINYLYTYN